MLCLPLIDGYGNSLHGRKQPIITHGGWHLQFAILNPGRAAGQPPEPLLSDSVIFQPELCQNTHPGAARHSHPGWGSCPHGVLGGLGERACDGFQRFALGARPGLRPATGCPSAGGELEVPDNQDENVAAGGIRGSWAPGPQRPYVRGMSGQSGQEASRSGRSCRLERGTSTPNVIDAAAR